MTPVDAILGVVLLGAVLYFLERRQTAAYRHELTRLGLTKDHTDALIVKIDRLTKQTEELESLVEKGEDRRNGALKTFLESFSDLIKESEEHKQSLRNRLQAAKLEKKQ